MRFRRFLFLPLLCLALSFTPALAQSPDTLGSRPDRKPSLFFTGNEMPDGLIRWSADGPTLHIINVGTAHLELYRLSERDDIVAAWLDRQQTALAPSESAYFARHKGKLVWSNDITVNDGFNKDIMNKISLPSGDAIAPGLYILVASAPNFKLKPSEKGLAPVAASLLLRSAISIRAAHDSDGIHILAETGDAPARDIGVALFDQDRHVLGEVKSDADGIAFLPQTEDKQGADALLIASTPAGDTAFADVHGGAEDHPVLPVLEPSISLPKPFYAPGEVVEATLIARDIHGHAVNVAAGGSLQILRADRSLYARTDVPAASNGVAHVTLPAPAINGAWFFVWQGADGATLTETALRVTPNRDAPRLTIEADRNILSGDNDVSLKISSVTSENEPAPYIAGKIAVAWTTPTHVFPGWDDYQFGGVSNEAAESTEAASFLTDANGKAQIYLNLKPPPNSASLRAAVINIKADPASGAADPASLTLPSTPAGVIVGIKPLAENGRFAENSRAHFALVALDTEGKRFAADNLSFEIFNEGRSFEWYQADGRWNYRPLQESRRIGGKSLALKAQGDNIIEWPVTSGTYRLDITDQDGKVLARAYFSAGWGTSKAVATAPAQLDLKPGAKELSIGTPAHVRFMLDTPTMATVFVSDDHIRKIIHKPGAKGANEVVFTPMKGWGDHIVVRIAAGNAEGEITLPLASESPKEAATTVPALDVAEWTPPVLTVGDTLEAELELKNNDAPAGTYKYAFYGPNLKIETTNGSLVLKEDEAKKIALTLHGMAAGAWPLKLEITGPRGFHLARNWTVDVRATPQALDKTTATKLDPEKSWQPSKTKRADGFLPGFLLVAPQSVSDAPRLLELAISFRPIATANLADRLEMLRLWHDAIVKAGFLSEQEFLSLRDETALRLLQRQKADGSFPSLPDGASDLVNTAAALMALAHVDRPDVKPAVEQADGWVKRQLENNWFDERERPARAATYALLAQAGKLDAGALHYFSDTSADKFMQPLAAVQLALAFAKINDRDAALYWLDRAGIKKNPARMNNPIILPYLADNVFFDPHDLTAIIDAMPANILAESNAYPGATPFLRTLAILAQRTGEWRVTVNGAVQNVNGVLVLPQTEKITAIANPNNDAIFIAEAAFGEASVNEKKSAITRRIYRLNGSDAGNGPFRRGEVYVVTLDGEWPEIEALETLLVVDDPGPGFSSRGCMIDEESINGEALGWIKGLNLSPLHACEKPQHSLLALVGRRDENAKSWRVAYLATADESGTFARQPAHAYMEREAAVEENTKDPIRIRK